MKEDGRDDGRLDGRRLERRRPLRSLTAGGRRCGQDGRDRGEGDAGLQDGLPSHTFSCQRRIGEGPDSRRARCADSVPGVRLRTVLRVAHWPRPEARSPCISRSPSGRAWRPAKLPANICRQLSLLRAKSSKDGDAELRGYRAGVRAGATLAEPPVINPDRGRLFHVRSRPLQGGAMVRIHMDHVWAHVERLRLGQVTTGELGAVFLGAEEGDSFQELIAFRMPGIAGVGLAIFEFKSHGLRGVAYARESLASYLNSPPVPPSSGPFMAPTGSIAVLLPRADEPIPQLLKALRSGRPAPSAGDRSAPHPVRVRLPRAQSVVAGGRQAGRRAPARVRDSDARRTRAHRPLGLDRRSRERPLRRVNRGGPGDTTGDAQGCPTSS